MNLSFSCAFAFGPYTRSLTDSPSVTLPLRSVLAEKCALGRVDIDRHAILGVLLKEEQDASSARVDR